MLDKRGSLWGLRGEARSKAEADVIRRALPLVKAVAPNIGACPGIVAGHILNHVRAMGPSFEWLQDRGHRIHLVGPVGIGKTSALAALSGLLLTDEEAEENTQGKPKARRASRSILATSAGRTTLCAVEIARADDWSITVEPAAPEALAAHVRDYAGEILAGVTAEGLVPEEIARAIRNMAGITRKEAEALAAEHAKESDLAQAILQRMAPGRRQLTLLHPDGQTSPAVWMQKTFADLNAGRLPGVPFPARIKVASPRFAMSVAGCKIILVDTKGGDGVGTRSDVHDALHDDRSIVVAASAFGALPDASTQSLVLHAREVTATLAHGRLAILGLAKGGEAEDCLLDTGERVPDARQGIQVKIMQAERVLAPMLRGLDVPLLAIDAHESDREEIEAARHVLLGMVERLRIDRLASLATRLDDLETLTGADGAAVGESLATLGGIVARVAEEHASIGNLPALSEISPFAGHASMNASVIWASTRRKGSYDGLDVHRLMADRITAAVVAHAETFKREMLAAVAGEDTGTLSETLGRRVRAFAEHAPARAAAAAHAALVRILSERVAADETLWTSCSESWGNPESRDGLGFRAFVARRFAARVEHAADLEAALRAGVASVWREIVDEAVGAYEPRKRLPGGEKKTGCANAAVGEGAVHEAVAAPSRSDFLKVLDKLHYRGDGEFVRHNSGYAFGEAGDLAPSAREADRILAQVAAVRSDLWGDVRSLDHLATVRDVIAEMRPEDFDPTADIPKTAALGGIRLGLYWDPTFPGEGWTSCPFVNGNQVFLATATFRQTGRRGFDVTRTTFYNPVTIRSSEEHRLIFAQRLQRSLEALDPKLLDAVYVRNAAVLANSVSRPPMDAPPELLFETGDPPPITMEFFDSTVELAATGSGYKVVGSRVTLPVMGKDILFRSGGTFRIEAGNITGEVWVQPLSKSLSKPEEKQKVALSAQQRLIDLIYERLEDLIDLGGQAEHAARTRTIARSYRTVRISLQAMWDAWDLAQSIRTHLRRIGCSEAAQDGQG